RGPKATRGDSRTPPPRHAPPATRGVRAAPSRLRRIPLDALWRFRAPTPTPITPRDSRLGLAVLAAGMSTPTSSDIPIKAIDSGRRDGEPQVKSPRRYRVPVGRRHPRLVPTHQGRPLARLWNDRGSRLARRARHRERAALRPGPRLGDAAWPPDPRPSRSRAP